MFENSPSANLQWLRSNLRQSLEKQSNTNSGQIIEAASEPASVTSLSAALNLGESKIILKDMVDEVRIQCEERLNELVEQVVARIKIAEDKINKSKAGMYLCF